MGRTRSNKIGSLTHQIQRAYDAKLTIGESKHQAKLEGRANDGIYSWNTYKSYMKHANYFANFCKENYGCRTLAECHQYINAFLHRNSELSAYTIKLEASAIAKLYGESSKQYEPTPSRERADITRSREVCARDKHFSATNHKEIVDFAKATGLRRSELAQIRGDSLTFINDKPYLHVVDGTKGGRERYTPIIGEHMPSIVQFMQEKGANKLFDKVPNGMDVHSYRADYATNYYLSIARPVDQIPFDKVNSGTGYRYQSEVYHCRGDRKGTSFDKKAMLEVSQALGHNRISVIGEHYLRID